MTKIALYRKRSIHDSLDCVITLVLKCCDPRGSFFCVCKVKSAGMRNIPALIMILLFCFGGVNRGNQHTADGAALVLEGFVWFVRDVAGVLLRCPIKSSGLRFFSILSTAATHSGRFICHRQRSPHSPDSHLRFKTFHPKNNPHSECIAHCGDDWCR